MAAEVRQILESAIDPQGRVKLGSLLADMGRRAKLSDEEFAVFEQVRSKAPASPASFECSARHQRGVKAAAPGARRPRGRADRCQATGNAVPLGHHGAELRAGVALLPAGKRRSGLQESLEMRGLSLFAGRVLAFDLGCTQTYVALVAKARASGFAIASAYGYIAAVSVANGLAVATRDSGPFEAAGAAGINPWLGSRRDRGQGGARGCGGFLSPAPSRLGRSPSAGCASSNPDPSA